MQQSQDVKITEKRALTKTINPLPGQQKIKFNCAGLYVILYKSATT